MVAWIFKEFEEHFTRVRFLGNCDWWFLLGLGRSCSTAVEHTPQNLDVVGSKPAGCRALFFIFLSFPTLLCVLCGYLVSRFSIWCNQFMPLKDGQNGFNKPVVSASASVRKLILCSYGANCCELGSTRFSLRSAILKQWRHWWFKSFDWLF